MYTQSKYLAGVREDENYNGTPNGIQDPSTRRKQSANYADRDNMADLANMGAGVAEDRRGMMPIQQSITDRRMSLGSTYSNRIAEISAREGLLGTKRPRPHKIWKKKFIKLMVVGDSGLGKTTLIKTLMSTPGERMQVHDGSYTPTEQFKKDPDSLISTVTWRDEEDRVIWVYKIQDTPGYSDELDWHNSIAMIKDHIELQNKKWLDLEQSKDRKEDLAEVEDPRMDLCIFCIPPHRIRPMDLFYLSEISQHVPVLPVVTKADTMTIREAMMYRQEVANKIANPMLPSIKEKINVVKFERDTLERAGVTDAATAIPPFLVIASNDINDELNNGEPPVFWPERRYPWGTAEAFNRDHSDLMSLRALLLKEALEEISKSKRARYEDWRRKQIGGIKIGRKIRNVLLMTLIPAFACLQLGRSGLTVKELKSIVHKRVQKLPIPARFKAKPVVAPVLAIEVAPPAPVAVPEPVPEVVAPVPEPAKKKGLW